MGESCYAKIIGKIKEEHQKLWSVGKELYIDLARRYKEGLKEIE